MYKLIEGLPDDVLGFEISGKLTHEDYVHGMLPECDKALANNKTVKMLSVVTSGFDGMELSAMWDDMSYGIKHWHDFSKIGLVSDEKWLRNMAAIFKPFIPAEVKVFNADEFEQAKSWITED